MSQLIPPPELVSLLLAFAPCFTRPSFRYLVAFIVAMIAATERLTSTTVYRSTEGHKHYTNYARFLSRYRWSVHQLSQRLLDLLLNRLPLWRDDQGRRRLGLVIDETMVGKSSQRMYGVAWQPNTHGGWCRGTHLLGHYWLMLGVLFPFAGRTLCCPLAFRLYRQKKRCPPAEYRTPCQLALELRGSLQWPPAPNLVRTVIADAGFADQHLLRWCAAQDFVAMVRGRMDAQGHDLYVRQPSPWRGRPRKYGEKISLVEYAQKDQHFTHRVHLYQNRTAVRVASVVGLHRASGLPLRFVLLRCAGKPDMVLMSSDLSLTPREIAQLYADRFAIEMTFRELKQHFGLGHYQVRRPEGILRHVHLSGLACALTQLLTLQPPSEGFGAGRLRPIRMPWRKPDTPASVHETQMVLRHVCLPPPTFAQVGRTGGQARKSRAPASTRTTGAQEVLN